MRKVKLSEIFAEKGGIIHGGDIPYRMDGEILMHNQRRDEAEHGWQPSHLNEGSFKLVCKMNRISESGVTDGLLAVREFERLFGFTPAGEFIVEVA